jgi:adenosylcobyric acid synthase
VNRSLLVCGTASDAGKSLLVAGICRWLARQGIRVAPFKAQNMALNSAVTPDGCEIGRAQHAQALAAGAVPEAAMNPVLIKPTGDQHSQVIVMGRPMFEAGARDYLARKQELLPVVLDALADLRSRYDVVICEGAGSPAEINLRPHDLVNLGLARAADLPVVVVGDIDRGGVFAALYGTLGLLAPEDQALVAGFVINRFRGDPAVLAPGLDQLTRLTGRPVLGVLPHLDGLWLDAEDSLALDHTRPSTPGAGPDVLDVAVVRLPRISNFTDVDAFTAEPGVTVRFTTSPRDVAHADLVVLPGSKNTVGDLAWLRASGLADTLSRRVATGAPVLGICGGYQMLGTTIVDRVESRAGEVDGLGRLPVVTTFAPDKLLGRRTGRSPRFGTPAGGYEIRHGRVTVEGGEPWLCGADGDEGCVVGEVYGTSWHGVLEHDALRRAFLQHVADVTGREWRPGSELFADVRARHHDRLGDLVAEHLDTVALHRLLEHGAPPGLPVVPPGGAPPPQDITGPASALSPATT